MDLSSLNLDTLVSDAQQLATSGPAIISIYSLGALLVLRSILGSVKRTLTNMTINQKFKKLVLNTIASSAFIGGAGTAGYGVDTQTWAVILPGVAAALWSIVVAVNAND